MTQHDLLTQLCGEGAFDDFTGNTKEAITDTQ